MSRPAPDPRPVAPKVQHIPLAGIVTASTTAEVGPRSVAGIAPRVTEQFETLGVTWRQDPDVGEVVVRARTRTGGVWNDWKELEEEEGTAAAGTATAESGRAGTEPARVGPSDGVQVRVEVESGKAPADLRLSLIDPGTSAADAGVAPTLGDSYAEAATPTPAIQPRAAWGADESIRTGSPSYASSLSAVAVHHTASSNTYEPADVPGISRGFYAFHVQSRDWSDIGYNVLVDKYGNAWEGRAGGLDKPVSGAHAGGFNSGTTGVSMIGTYETAPSEASLEAVAEVVACKLSSYGRDPKGPVTLTSAGSTKYPAGTKVTLPRIFGHRDVSATGCPGGGGYEALRTIRDRAATLAAAPTSPSTPGTPRRRRPRRRRAAPLRRRPRPGSRRSASWSPPAARAPVCR